MKICFVAQNIYPCLAQKNEINSIGGAELQQIFMGKGLRDRGYDISYITRDYGQPEGESIDGLRIIKSFEPEEGLFGIRFYYPRLYKIWQALKRANADVYYVRSATFLPGILAIYCKIYGKKFVFAGAHDTNFNPCQFRFITRRDKILYKYGLRHANAIITQSNIQKSLLWKHFKLNSTVIRNFYPFHTVKLPASQRKYILWVSTIRSWKRPLQFINLAEAFPSEKFIMIGGPDLIQYAYLYERVKKKTEQVKNLSFLGFQPLNVTESYFDRCKIFVNTSVYEGFPNTFLQSWNRGIHVISYVDPDHVISKNKLGFVVTSEQELHKSLSEFLSNSSWDNSHILDYFTKNHSFETIEQYCLLFDSLLSQSGRRHF
jgi:glycosyltransferase involved in cell wall biosynthesis